MKLKKYNILFFLFFLCFKTSESNFKSPTVVIAILVRNKAHTLPYFLTFLERLDYPKNRITLWIKSDNNIDNSINVLKSWLKPIEESYHHVHTQFDKKSSGFSDEINHSDWSSKRFFHIMNLREEALEFARQIWADYIFILDADAFIVNPQTINLLISHNLPVVSPLLKSEGLYSNFWAGMTEEYYYLRTEEYISILNYKKIGCTVVPMVHSAVFIDLRRSITDLLTYQSKNIPDYNGPNDDIIAFAVMAKKSDVPLYICNDNIYGYIPVPLEKNETINKDKQQVINFKLEMLDYMTDIPILKRLENYILYPQKNTLGLSKIFMINLAQRTDRRTRMLRCFEELGLEVEIINAVDGSNLTQEDIENYGIELMKNYSDPYHKRPMTLGEIGCFLSHYNIWKTVVENDYENVIILEDDVKFEPYFRQKINFIFSEIQELNIAWDFIYLGRKRLHSENEMRVKDSKSLVYAGYSYWTIGYILSYSGANKLLDAQPLKNLLPVDEYIPIIFDDHPRIDWKDNFHNRNLIALSVMPLLLHPTHYTGDSGYISDTHNSKTVQALNSESLEDTTNRDEF